MGTEHFRRANLIVVASFNELDDVPLIYRTLGPDPAGIPDEPDVTNPLEANRECLAAVKARKPKSVRVYLGDATFEPDAWTVVDHALCELSAAGIRVNIITMPTIRPRRSQTVGLGDRWRRPIHDNAFRLAVAVIVSTVLRLFKLGQ